MRSALEKELYQKSFALTRAAVPRKQAMYLNVLAFNILPWQQQQRWKKNNKSPSTSEYSEVRLWVEVSTSVAVKHRSVCGIFWLSSVFFSQCRPKVKTIAQTAQDSKLSHDLQRVSVAVTFWKLHWFIFQTSLSPYLILLMTGWKQQNIKKGC